MKDYLRQLVASQAAPQARNRVREYLQALILAGLQRAGAFTSIAFQGGTALRFLFSIPRYSEDLDFALERPGASGDVRVWLERVEADLRRENLSAELARVNDRKAVHSAFVRFPGLLYELGVSAQPAEALAVRVEVDTRPPAGARLETSVVRRHVTLRLPHHDRASLLAGKLHAILCRGYPKGRDWYDLVWYLADPSWPAPNLELLNNALRQTGAAPVTSATWRRAVRRRLEELDWAALQRDARPFLERPDGVELLTPETLRGLLRTRGTARR